MEGASLTRGLLSGLVERPEEAPLMDRDLGTQVQSRAQLRRATGAQLLFPQEAWVPRTVLLSPPRLSSSGETLQPLWDPIGGPWCSLGALCQYLQGSGGQRDEEGCRFLETEPSLYQAPLHTPAARNHLPPKAVLAQGHQLGISQPLGTHSPPARSRAAHSRPALGPLLTCTTRAWAR